MTRLTFRLKGSTFTTDVWLKPHPLVPADLSAKSAVALACQRLGGVAPNQLELIA